MTDHFNRDIAALKLLAYLEQGTPIVWLEGGDPAECFINDCARQKMLDPDLYFIGPRSKTGRNHARLVLLEEFSPLHPAYICYGCGNRIDTHP
jgi:hypothetical protein